MREVIEYGVFQVGQVWRVVGAGRNEQGFPSLERAIEAANVLVAAHRACGQVAMVMVQDDSCRLIEFGRRPDEARAS